MSKRTRLSYEQAQAIWAQWQKGACMADIVRALAVSRGMVERELRRCGGMSPRGRTRSRRSLSSREREVISRGLAAGRTLRTIALDLDRAPSTISREVKRNGGAEAYRACEADERAWRRASRPKACLLAGNPQLRRLVAHRLSRRWSPRQISRSLERDFPQDHNLRVSPETIYRTLYVQSRGALKKELAANLRRAQPIRRPASNRSQGRRGQIQGAIPISQRPAEAADRAVPGHWEGDLLAGSRNTYIGTLVERSSRYTLLMKLEGKDTDTVIAALKRKILNLPSELRRSVTWDRGHEMADHVKFTVDTGVQIYFCDPQSPWQRGSNENTNGLLRQYFPKKTNLSIYSQNKLNAIARELNQRPRETLDWASPAEFLANALR
jgi:IS30 family transposase